VDGLVDGFYGPSSTDWSAVHVIATCHDEFYRMSYPCGSVIIDPWGQMPDQEGVEVIRVGREERI